MILQGMISHERLENFMEKKVIEVSSFGFYEGGGTLDDTFVILDEA